MLRGAAWSAPAVALASNAPAAVASPVTNPNQTSVDYGLYVSTQFNGGYFGYTGSNGASTGWPTTPQGYFAASPRPESDANWSDAANAPTNTSSFVNGEGVFTPATNGGGSTGSYISTSGFWFSVPTTSPGTGTGYVAGSSTTLAAGATFVTTVSATIPAGANALWPLQNAKINGTVWNKTLTGSLTLNGTGGTYNYNVQAPATWTASAPTVVKNADGSATLTGTITVTTTSNLTVTQTGTKYYGQVVIMPATLQILPSYGWTNFSLTSYVQSASLSYTVPSPYIAPTTTAVSGLTTTSAIHP